jgi:tripartite-type tricarboxylate transporter receptor subunit TctC
MERKVRSIRGFVKYILFGCLAAIAMSQVVLAEGYPTKPIKLIVPYAAGGGGDIMSRFIADLAGDMMGIKVIVENKTGGGSTIGINAVAKSNPDGYTVGFVSTSPITIRPHLMSTLYEPLEDLTYLGQFVSSPMPVVVRSDSPWNTLDDMMAFAKANPGKLRWSTAGQNGGPHVAFLAALKQENTTATFIPSKGGSKAMASLLSGIIDMAAISDFSAALSAGKVRIIAETTPTRSDIAPEAPTLIEAGYPLSPAIFYGLAGPADLPQDVIDTWDTVLSEIMQSPKFIDLLKKLHATPKYANSAEFTAVVQTDYVAAKEVLSTIK